MRLHRHYLPWERVWGRDPREFVLVTDQPVESGIIRPREGRANPGCVVIRPAMGRDHQTLDDLRLSDRPWLAPWEPTSPPQAHTDPPTVRQYRRIMDRLTRRGDALVMMIEVDRQPCGVVSVNGIVRGALYGGLMGYWVHSSMAGRGIGAYAVASVIDLLIGELGLHRVEINVRPENGPSLSLVRKLGLREEGYRARYLHINGVWADHVQFAIDSEDFPSGGVVSYLLRQVDRN